MFLTVACVLAALLMIAVSASMNFLFMKSLATREVDGIVLGAASAAADILKAALPWFVALAWRQRRIVFAGVGSSVFVGFSIFSLLSALGFAADLRSNMSGKREAANAALSQKQSEETSLKKRRSALGTVRPEHLIAADLAIARQDRRWASSKECTDATVPGSRAFCQTYLGLQASLVSSREAARLDKQLAAIGGEIAVMRAAGAGTETDPQVAVIARLLSQERDVVRTVLIVAAALLVEAGSGLGLWLALGHSEPPRGDGLVAPLDTAARIQLRKTEAQPAKAVNGNVLAARPAPRVAGSVVDFCIDRVHPTRDGGLTVLGLYRSYEAWCQSRDFAPVTQVEFASEFGELAREMGIVEKGDVFVGVRVGREFGTASTVPVLPK
ncbi:hypothetical protein ACO2I3_19385 [Leptospira interrogans]